MNETISREYLLLEFLFLSRRQQERLDKQHRFDSQRQHLDNIHKDNYGQIQDLKRSGLYATVVKTLQDNQKKEYLQKG